MAGLPTRHIGRLEALELCPQFSPAISGAVNALDAHQDTRVLVALLVKAAEAVAVKSGSAKDMPPDNAQGPVHRRNARER